MTNPPFTLVPCFLGKVFMKLVRTPVHMIHGRIAFLWVNCMWHVSTCSHQMHLQHWQPRHTRHPHITKIMPECRHEMTPCPGTHKRRDDAKRARSDGAVPVTRAGRRGWLRRPAAAALAARPGTAARPPPPRRLPRPAQTATWAPGQCTTGKATSTGSTNQLGQ